MATSVISAFNEFLKNSVNLDTGNTRIARRSRDWLLDRIREFPRADSTFPMLFSEKDIFFGSFARRTKKRPLDDIDMMVCLHAQRGTYFEEIGYIRIDIHEDSNLKGLCNYNTNTLNSIKVVNKFVSALTTVPQYSKADIKRNQEAATLKLSSYDWNFDIAPCFLTSEDYYGHTYYLIPDGAGNWKKTDPRLDRDRVRKVNTDFGGNILQAIRTMKYWNKRPTMPSMGSYLLENMILDHYESQIFGSASEFVDIELPGLFAYVRDNVHNAVNDPKGIQGDINTMTIDERHKIWVRANEDLGKALRARQLESGGDQKGSIEEWRRVFGTAFPAYG